MHKSFCACAESSLSSVRTIASHPIFLIESASFLVASVRCDSLKCMRRARCGNLADEAIVAMNGKAVVAMASEVVLAKAGEVVLAMAGETVQAMERGDRLSGWSCCPGLLAGEFVLAMEHGD